MKKIALDTLCIVILVFLNRLILLLFGFQIFSLFPNFDKLLHFFTGMFLADIYFCLPFRKHTLRIVMFVLVISIAWESAEPYLSFLGIGEMSSLFTMPWLIDTLGDIASAVAGGLIYSYFRQQSDT